MSEFPIPTGEVVDQYTEVINGRKRVFTLSETHVHVRMTRGLGQFHDVRVPLEWLSPDYATSTLRTVNLQWVGISQAFLLLPLTFVLYADAKPPSPWFFIAIGLTALGVCLSFTILIKAFVPRPIYRFANGQGVFVLDAIAVGPDKDRCEGFADAIRERVLALKRPQADPLSVH